MNPNKMSASECADWCAVDDGNRWDADECRAARAMDMHPYDVTIDGAKAAMPKGVGYEVAYYCNGTMKWSAGLRDGSACAEECEDEVTARWRLVVMCRIAMKEAANGT